MNLFDAGTQQGSLEAQIAELRQRVEQLAAQITEPKLRQLCNDQLYGAFTERTLLPPLIPTAPADSPFPSSSTCTAADFYHPRFYALTKLLAVAPCWHRKLWEWVFIAHHLADYVRPGWRGLGFGVGTEPLPAMLASLGAHIVATDAPDDRGMWSEGQQWSGSIDGMRRPSIIADSILEARVSFRPADMNHIPVDLNGFDFTWSSCAFEHLGSIEAGLTFVEKSVATLKPGGIAVHTTEFNVSSNDDTVEEGDTVLFRQKDFDILVDRLRSQGHQVEPFVQGPMAHFLDNHVDVPPFSAYPHLKLRLAGYVTTSAGIVVRRGQ